MAFDFSKLKFFSRLDARMRIIVLIAGVAALVFLVYLGTVWIFGDGSAAVGPSSVATAPSGLQSVPGGKGLTPQYQQALQQASQQAAEAATMSGTSALPTLMNTSVQEAGGSAGCIICSEESANVKNLLDGWVRSGKISRAVADELQKLANQNVSPEEYAARLEQLVKEGKLTPEQARELLAQYKKQHANGLLKESTGLMDDMIKKGTLPIDVANELLAAQKKKISPAEYAALLQRLVREGKLSPEAAQALLSQYTQQYAKQVTMQSIAILKQWAAAGEIIPEVEKNLIDLENQRVPLDIVDQVLKKYVSQGKLTPVVSDKIHAEYVKQKAMMGPGGTVDGLVKNAEDEAYQELKDLVKEGKITEETADTIRAMIPSNASIETFNQMIANLVKEKKLTPDIAKLKMADYKKVIEMRALAATLSNLHANNATPEQYAEALKRAVQAGLITPEEAARLMNEYQAIKSASVPGAPEGTAIPETAAFAKMQAAASGQTIGTLQAAVPASQFAVPTGLSEEDATAANQEQQARLQALSASMAGQAQQLINAWQPTPMAHFEASAADLKQKSADTSATLSKEEQAAGKESKTGKAEEVVSKPLIKAGTILFAVLDTEVISDYPDSPVMATIVDGPYRGTRLLGKLATTKGVTGQLDRVTLNFTLMNKEDWDKSKSITAFAIDPDTARSVLASSVDYHYAMRWGALIATSFIQGYADAIKTSGSQTSSTPSGTFSSNPQLSPAQKLAVGLGQVGESLGTVTQSYTQLPPTVKIDAGVSLGILFMQDVT